MQLQLRYSENQDISKVCGVKSKLMQDRNKLVQEKLADGSYYKDSIEHYVARYVYPTNVRAHYFAIGMFMLFACIVSIWTFMLDIARAPLPFVIYAQDQVLYYPILKPLASKKEPIETSAARYLVERYVKLRENYDPANFSDENKDLLMRKIKALSSIESYYDFEKYMNPETNNTSPILLYKNKYIRDIDITHSQWFSDVVDGTGVDIEYEATITNKLTGEAQKSNKKVRIKFIMSDLGQIIDKTTKFYFAITDYKTY